MRDAPPPPLFRWAPTGWRIVLVHLMLQFLPGMLFVAWVWYGTPSAVVWLGAAVVGALLGGALVPTLEVRLAGDALHVRRVPGLGRWRPIPLEDCTAFRVSTHAVEVRPTEGLPYYTEAQTLELIRRAGRVTTLCRAGYVDPRLAGCALEGNRALARWREEHADRLPARQPVYQDREHIPLQPGLVALVDGALWRVVDAWRAGEHGWVERPIRWVVATTFPVAWLHRAGVIAGRLRDTGQVDAAAHLEAWAVADRRV